MFLHNNLQNTELDSLVKYFIFISGVIGQIRFILSNHLTTGGNPQQEKLTNYFQREIGHLRNTSIGACKYTFKGINTDDKLLKIFRQN